MFLYRKRSLLLLDCGTGGVISTLTFRTKAQ